MSTQFKNEDLIIEDQKRRINTFNSLNETFASIKLKDDEFSQTKSELTTARGETLE